MSGPDRAGAAASAEALAASFLSAVLPSRGVYFIATPFPKGGYKHYSCDTVEDAARLAIDLDLQGKTVYFATAAFVSPCVDVPQSYEKTSRKYRIRTNVRALRSLFLDIDVKPAQEDAYALQSEAADALDRFYKEIGLPQPLAVISGRGLHAYFPLESEVSLADWQPAADKLKALCYRLNFRADPSRTADATSVLRPVGTTHRKDPANPLTVTPFTEATPISFERLCEILDAACERHAVTITSRRAEPDAKGTNKRLNEQFAVQRDFPPCSARKVADHCAQLAKMRDTKGCISEPLWYAGIQLMCHSIEGDELIHEWSNGYSGYSREETDRKIQQVRNQQLGPTLCSTFESRNPGGCDACPLKGKITSPIQLGAAALDIPVIPATPEPSEPLPFPSSRSGGEPPRGFGALAVPTAQDPITQALMELNSQYAWVQKQKQIFRFQYQDFIEPAAFKITLANRPPVQIAVGNNDPKSVPLADAWLRWPGRREHLGIVYEPGKDSVLDNRINLWPGWGCKPSEGNIGPWRDLLDEAFGRGTLERTWFEQWVAYPIQLPGTKLFTAVMLWGAAQGLGKSLIGQTIGKIYGENYREIDNDAMDKPFNAWVKGKQFILGEELTSGDRRTIMNKLKHLITGETIGLDEKYQPEIVLRNTINFMFTSNNPDALHIDINDRRMCIIEFVGSKLPKEFFDDFLSWRDTQGGTNALMHHLLHLSLTGFSPTAEAPKTRAKEDMMDATFSDIERWLFERFLDPRAPLNTEVVYTGDLVGQYLGQKGQHVSETAVGRALTRLGSSVKKRVAFPDARKQLHALRRQQHWAAADEKAWAEEYEKGRTVGAQISAAKARLAPAEVPQSHHGLN